MSTSCATLSCALLPSTAIFLPYYLLKTSLKAKNFFLPHYHSQQLQHGHRWISHTQSLQSLNSHLYLRWLFSPHLTLPTLLSLYPSLFYPKKSSCWTLTYTILLLIVEHLNISRGKKIIQYFTLKSKFSNDHNSQVSFL